MKVAKIPFEETVISLDAPDFKDVVGPVSGTGKVPVLIDGDVHVWESLAILEYLAEKFPNARLWPADSAARALARAVSNEMHAGFLPLRQTYADEHVAAGDQARPDARSGGQCTTDRNTVVRVPRTVRQEGDGPFLFGAFGAADAMYAPVVARLHTYGVDVGAATQVLHGRCHGAAGLGRMARCGAQETWMLAADEVDWPTVHRV